MNIDFKELFAKHLSCGEQVYMPPVKVDIVSAGVLYTVSLDEGITDEEKLKGQRRFDMAAGIFSFEDALRLLLNINARTYNGKVSVNHKGMPANKAKRFCELYTKRQGIPPGDVSVAAPENKLLMIGREINEDRYTLRDIIEGKPAEIAEHLRELDTQIVFYEFSKIKLPKY